ELTPPLRWCPRPGGRALLFRYARPMSCGFLNESCGMPGAYGHRMDIVQTIETLPGVWGAPIAALVIPALLSERVNERLCRIIRAVRGTAPLWLQAVRRPVERK